mgnify:CR=1 FL=1
MQVEARATVLRGPKGGQSYWALSLRRLMRKKLGVGCLAVILLMYGSGILAPFVTPYGYNDQNLAMAKQPPPWVGARVEDRCVVECTGLEGELRTITLVNALLQMENGKIILGEGASGEIEVGDRLGLVVRTAGTWSHPFGTDRLGRDILTRIIFGLRTTVIITVTTLVTGSLVLGITMGLVAGYFGRLIDTIIMRVGEVTSAFPEIFLVLIIVATVKPPVTDWVRGIEDTVGFDIVRLGIVDYMIIALALAIFSWFGMARLVRGQVLQVRENQYVEAARAVGVSTPRILLRHVFPNVIGPVIVVSSAGLAGIAGSEIFLSWLGIGIQPPTPSLGLMIFENGSISVLRTNPHLLLFPVGTLALLLFTFNLLGDAMNDAFNPRTR